MDKKIIIGIVVILLILYFNIEKFESFQSETYYLPSKYSTNVINPDSSQIVYNQKPVTSISEYIRNHNRYYVNNYV
jgi:hypothetical protein